MEIIKNADMSRYTSFRAGGSAKVLMIPGSIDELKQVLRELAVSGGDYMIMGNGSNILVRDGGYDGTIVRIGEGLDQISADGEMICAGSGALLSSVAAAALASDLTGFEFAGGIPGSIGGAAFMNAGAYDGEMKDVISRVDLISKDGSREYALTAAEMEYGYRHSVLYDTGDIVSSVEIKLQRGSHEAIAAKMKELTERRTTKQPLSYPSAGSFFKRPAGYYAGKLIQDAGLKGLSVGGAQVSELHSGFIINTGKATASDIIALMHIVQASVMDKFGVRLEPEVRIIGTERQAVK